jgi:hypothetical protein
MVKRITLADFMAASASSELSVMNVDEKDKLGWVLVTAGGQEVMLVSNEGMSIRFAEEDVRSMGLAAGGVGGMKLKKGVNIIYAAPVDPQGELLTITAQGYAKRSVLSEYSSQGRNGGGIVTHKTTSRTGAVTAALLIGSTPPEAIIVLPRKGGPKSVGLDEIPTMGRGVQGKQVVDLGDSNPVVTLRSVTSSYQVAVENRAVVEEEIGDSPIGAVKKVSPFPKANPAGTTNGSNGKDAPPAENGHKPPPAKASKAEAIPAASPAVSKSVVKPPKPKPAKTEVAKAEVAKGEVASNGTHAASNGAEKPGRQTPVKAKGEVVAPSPKRETVRRETPNVKVETPMEQPKAAKRDVSKAKADAPTPASKLDSVQRDTRKSKVEGAAPSPKREPVQQTAPKTKIEPPKAETAKREPSKAKAEVATSTPKRETAQRAASKPKIATPEPSPLPQQPSLLPDDKTTVAPRSSQKLAAVTSVKRPKK